MTRKIHTFIIYVIFFFNAVLGTESRTSYRLGKLGATPVAS
jgi:hypothetical protein